MLTACKCHHRETSEKSRSSGGRSVQVKRPARQIDSGLRLRRQNNRSECHPGAHPPVSTSQIGAQLVWAAAVERAGPMTKMQAANSERPEGSTEAGAVNGQPAFAMGKLWTVRIRPSPHATRRTTCKTVQPGVGRQVAQMARWLGEAQTARLQACFVCPSRSSSSRPLSAQAATRAYLKITAWPARRPFAG
jgi:hypothetical protein